MLRRGAVAVTTLYLWLCLAVPVLADTPCRIDTREYATKADCRGALIAAIANPAARHGFCVTE